MDNETKTPLTGKDIFNSAGREGKKVVGFAKDAGNKILEVANRKEKLSLDPEYERIIERNNQSTRLSGFISFLGPVMGTIGGPLFAIFRLGLDDEKTALLGSILIGAAIGNVIGGLISLFVMKLTVRNRTEMTYVEMKGKLEIADANVLRKNEEISELKGVISKHKDVEEELLNFRIEKRAKELNEKNKNHGGGPNERQ